MTASEKAPAPRNNDLIYGLDDRPHLTATVFAALQHVLASFVGIITPTLIMGSALGLQSEIPYLISMESCIYTSRTQPIKPCRISLLQASVTQVLNSCATDAQKKRNCYPVISLIFRSGEASDQMMSA
ncbi:hypothetical protein QF013_002654 [Pseudomonas laurylsulfatiphila]